MKGSAVAAIDVDRKIAMARFEEGAIPEAGPS